MSLRLLGFSFSFPISPLLLSRCKCPLPEWFSPWFQPLDGCFGGLGSLLLGLFLPPFARHDVLKRYQLDLLPAMIGNAIGNAIGNGCQSRAGARIRKAGQAYVRKAG
jgi:hypothetical protein